MEKKAPLLALLWLLPALSAQASTASLMSFDAVIRESGSDQVVVVAPRYSEQALSANSDAASICQLLGFRSPRAAETAIEPRPPRGGTESALVLGRSGRPEAIEPRAQRLIRSIECRQI